jgi:hypothetical protein
MPSAFLVIVTSALTVRRSGLMDRRVEPGIPGDLAGGLKAVRIAQDRPEDDGDPGPDPRQTPDPGQGRLALDAPPDVAPEPVRFGGRLLGEGERTRHQDPSGLVEGRLVRCGEGPPLPQQGALGPVLPRPCHTGRQASPGWSRARTTRPADGGTQTVGNVPSASILARRSASTRSVCRPDPQRFRHSGGATTPRPARSTSRSSGGNAWPVASRATPVSGVTGAAHACHPSGVLGNRPCAPVCSE